MLEQSMEVFYNEYFKKQAEFQLVKEFEKKDQLYVGVIETIDMVHPISIDVEIPVTFPHHKMVFWTNSLSGYPHLIYGIDPYLKKDIPANRGWFCLNTPFAETPQAQLDLEMIRLRGWLSRYLRPDLPAHITNEKVARALAVANAYNWENQDEVGERSHIFGLTFVGDFASDVDYFTKHKTGSLHCTNRTTRNNQFHLFAFKEKENTDIEVPYVIVDNPCSLEQMGSFAQLRSHFEWDATSQERLLPKFDLEKKWELNTGLYHIYWSHLDEIKQNRDRIVIAPEDQPAIDDAIAELERLKAEDYFPNFNEPEEPEEDDPDFDEKMAAYGAWWNEQQKAEQEHERYMYDWHYFVIGFLVDNHIYWRLFWTSRRHKKYRSVSYKMGEFHTYVTHEDGTQETHDHPIDIEIKHFLDIEMNHYPADTINYAKFFGRGQFCSELVNKNIAIIGAGAIGSTLALALARGGARSIGIWDGDHVEPGNICRSSYRSVTVGTQKSKALATLIKEVSPFCVVKNVKGDFYAAINYDSQDDIIKDLADYDIVIDCTATNEILHFLSYAVPDKLLISLCITNHAQDLVCVSNRTGNPFEIQKAFLSKIEQDTDNYYVEGTGCFDPTFLATNADINALLNLALRDINQALSKERVPGSVVYSYTDRGIISDYLHVFTLADNSITLIVSAETLLDAEDVPDVSDGKLGQLFGTYSRDGKTIFLTDFVPQSIVESEKVAISDISDGILEYIGEYRYSSESAGLYNIEDSHDIILLAANEAVNTYNPLLALRNPDGSTSFYLYIDNQFEPFFPKEEKGKRTDANCSKNHSS